MWVHYLPKSPFSCPQIKPTQIQGIRVGGNSRKTNGKAGTTTEESEKETTKKKKKQLKKKKKRHLRKVLAMEKAVKIKLYLRKEEESMDLIHVSEVAKFQKTYIEQKDKDY